MDRLKVADNIKEYFLANLDKKEELKKLLFDAKVSKLNKENILLICSIPESYRYLLKFELLELKDSTLIALHKRISKKDNVSKELVKVEKMSLFKRMFARFFKKWEQFAA